MPGSRSPAFAKGAANPKNCAARSSARVDGLESPMNLPRGGNGCRERPNRALPDRKGTHRKGEQLSVKFLLPGRPFENNQPEHGFQTRARSARFMRVCVV